MPIYRGSTLIDAVYRGSTKVDKVYRGSTLVADYTAPAPTYNVEVRATAVSPYSQTQYNGTTSKTATMPTNAVGDIIILCITMDYGALSGLVLPAQFTEIARQGGSASKLVVGWKRVTGTEPSTYTYSTNVDADSGAVAIAIKDPHQTTAPVVASGNGGAIANGGSVTWSGVTPASGTNLLIRVVARNGASGSTTMSWAHASTSPATTELSDTTFGGWTNLGTFSQRHDSTAATGTRSATLTTNDGTTRNVPHAHIAIPQRT